VGRLSLIVALAVLSGACHARDPFRLTERRMQNLLHQGSVITGCPAVAMTSERLSDRVFRVSGCGTYADFAAYVRGHGRYSGARWVHVVPVTDRASAQLGCPASAATFTPQGPTRYLVTGCGTAATFDLQCGAVDCGWALTGQSAMATAPPVVAAATPQVLVPPPPATDASGAIQAALQSVRTSALACSGNQPFTADITWDGAGHVTLALAPPFRGTAVETCVAGVLSQVQVSGAPGVPGHVVAQVQ
jgi:hypothetical protein